MPWGSGIARLAAEGTGSVQCSADATGSVYPIPVIRPYCSMLSVRTRHGAAQRARSAGSHARSSTKVEPRAGATQRHDPTPTVAKRHTRAIVAMGGEGTGIVTPTHSRYARHSGIDLEPGSASRSLGSGYAIPTSIAVIGVNACVEWGSTSSVRPM